jgi:hypothetical protein
MGFRAPAVTTRPGLSSAKSRTRRTTPATRARTPLTPAGAVDAGAGAANASADAAGAAGCGKEPAVPAPAPSPVGKAGALAHWVLRRRLLRLMPIKLVWCDT